MVQPIHDVLFSMYTIERASLPQPACPALYYPFRYTAIHAHTSWRILFDKNIPMDVFYTEK